ncbi:MAG: hypothetical protein WBP56_08865, partial [Polyangia bacterium]
MKTTLTVSLCLLLLGLGVARSQEMSPVGDSTTQISNPGATPQAAQPPTPAPDMQPPPPPQQPP